jgi:hypothetical protein
VGHGAKAAALQIEAADAVRGGVRARSLGCRLAPPVGSIHLGSVQGWCRQLKSGERDGMKLDWFGEMVEQRTRAIGVEGVGREDRDGQRT